jgi:hypothetical protein
MKKISSIITGVIILLILVTCEKGSENTGPEDLLFIDTELGGCHETDFSNLKNTEYGQADTVVFTVTNDTLDIFIGLNYICCAPFSYQTTISNDLITISINDICQANDGTCYCKCTCYYTWNFMFTGSLEKEYQYKIILNDPRKDAPVLIEEESIIFNE